MAKASQKRNEEEKKIGSEIKLACLVALRDGALARLKPIPLIGFAPRIFFPSSSCVAYFHVHVYLPSPQPLFLLSLAGLKNNSFHSMEVKIRRIIKLAAVETKTKRNNNTHTHTQSKRTRAIPCGVCKAPFDWLDWTLPNKLRKSKLKEITFATWKAGIYDYHPFIS